MKRTTALGNLGNLYTEGDAGLGVPATVVGASEMNAIQEELANTIENAGISLNEADPEQLSKAINALLQAGGDTQTQNIDNNASNQNITALIFDKLLVKAARATFQISRKTDAPTRLDEMGFLWMQYNEIDDLWEIKLQSNFADAEVTFAINSSGQVSYSSTNLAGANYLGIIRITEILTLEL